MPIFATNMLFIWCFKRWKYDLKRLLNFSCDTIQWELENQRFKTFIKLKSPSSSKRYVWLSVQSIFITSKLIYIWVEKLMNRKIILWFSSPQKRSRHQKLRYRFVRQYCYTTTLTLGSDRLPLSVLCLAFNWSNRLDVVPERKQSEHAIHANIQFNRLCP